MARIKIKDHDRRPYSSIAVVVAAAVLIWVAWLLWSFDRPLVVRQRGLEQIDAPYLCAADHLHHAKAGPRSLLCPHDGCDERAWPVWTYQCSRDGGRLLQLRYADEAVPRISKVRAPGAGWRDVGQAISCTLCDRTLQADLSFRSMLLTSGPGSYPAHP